MDPLLPLCLRAVRRWTGDLPPPADADVASLYSLLLRVPVDTLDRFLRSDTGSVEGTSAPPLPSPAATGPGCLAFVLHLALRAARQRIPEAAPDVQQPQRYLPWLTSLPDMVAVLRQMMPGLPAPLAAPTMTTSTARMHLQQQLPVAPHVEGPITNRMIRSLLLAWRSSGAPTRKEMFLLWATLQTVRFLLPYVPHQEHTVREQQDVGQSIDSEEPEDISVAQLVDSKGPGLQIVTNVEEAEDAIALKNASGAEVLFDVPMDMSLDTLNGVMDCFTKHGAAALLSGPNVTELLKSAQELVGGLE